MRSNVARAVAGARLQRSEDEGEFDLARDAKAERSAATAQLATIEAISSYTADRGSAELDAPPARSVDADQTGGGEALEFSLNGDDRETSGTFELPLVEGAAPLAEERRQKLFARFRRDERAQRIHDYIL